MSVFSVPVDPVPARAKIDLELHRPTRSWLRFGRRRCEWCWEAWGRFGCWFRETAARTFVTTATAAQQRAALSDGRITRDDLHLHRRKRPVGAHRPKPKRKPSPHPQPSLFEGIDLSAVRA